MENSKLSNVKGKELVAAGHAFAKVIGMDTPLIEVAKMVSELATRLDCALVRGDELQKERDALAAAHSELRESMAAIHNTIRLDGVNTSLGALLSASKRAHEASLPTDAYLNSVRAEGVEMFAAHQRAMIGKPHKNDAATSYAARCAVEYAAQLRAGKDGE